MNPEQEGMGLEACPHGVSNSDKCNICRTEEGVEYTENPNALTPDAARGGEYDLDKE